MLALAALRAAEPAPWQRLSGGPLTVYSDAPLAKARQWTRELEHFRCALPAVVPLPAHAWEPLTVFLYESDAQLRAVLPPQTNGEAQKIRAFTASLAGRHVLALSIEGAPEIVRSTLYHEVTHWYLRGSKTPLPLWLDEGLAVTLQTFVFDGANGRVGEPLPGLQQMIRGATPLPMAQVVGQRGLDYTDAGMRHGQTDLYYAEAWALTIWELCGQRDGGVAKISDYLRALDAGATGEEAFRRGFGEPLADAEKRALDAARSAVKFKPLRLLLSAAQKEPPFVETVAERAELDRARGFLLCAVGRFDEARDVTRAAADEQPSTADAWALAAFAAVAANRPADAKPLLTTAEALGCNDARLYCAIGQAYTLNVKTVAVTRGGPSGDNGATTGAAMYRRACQLQQDLQAAYEGLAFLSVQSDAMNDDDRKLLTGAATRFPRSGVVHMALAMDDIRANRRAEAKERINRVKPTATFRSETERRLFEFLSLTLMM